MRYTCIFVSLLAKSYLFVDSLTNPSKGAVLKLPCRVLAGARGWEIRDSGALDPASFPTDRLL